MDLFGRRSGYHEIRPKTGTFPIEIGTRKSIRCPSVGMNSEAGVEVLCTPEYVEGVFRSKYLSYLMESQVLAGFPD